MSSCRQPFGHLEDMSISLGISILGGKNAVAGDQEKDFFFHDKRHLKANQN